MTKEASLEKICLRLRRPIVYRCILYEIDDIDILLDNHLLALTVMHSGKLGGFQMNIYVSPLYTPLSIQNPQ